MSNLPPAEKNCEEIYSLIKSIGIADLGMGYLLIENKENGHWSSAPKVDSFKDFCEMLNWKSWSWITRIIRIAEAVLKGLLTEEEVKRWGITKTVLFLPLVEQGKLTPEIRAIADNGTTRDLRLILKGKSDEEPRYDGFIICGRCGNRIDYRKGMEHWAEIKGR